ncbi:hypothetical protein CWR48_08975 [Oceanobacillus arenosus]|uniref:DUF4179 domain-containing protein n=1 Tax=Oceanobacillus arenosus TaxID=1229153 RepID=A0A3D8PTX6_9BACI|nr:DUF4179 domain-containing protein [Oceanobacillus arenosus]RDW19172.1 hypothetical protein CWR48_08975 [Oceanobacillus arenosus]
MICPSKDKLDQWFDMFDQVDEIIQSHVETCKECQQVIKMYREEQELIKETLSTPTLPDDFTIEVLKKLEPYEQKKKRNKWKWTLPSAAACVLAVGLTTNLNPSFAEWIGGLFTTEIVDQGLHIASENGHTNRINQEVADNGITFRVEDLLADTSRVALSFQAVKKNGEKFNPQFDNRSDGKNVISAYDQDGNPIKDFGYINGSDYGLIEFYLRGYESIDSLTIKFELTELNGTRGNWQLEIPVDLNEIKERTTRVVLDDQKISENGVGIHIKEVQFAPTSNEFMYDTYFTAEEKAKVEAQIQELENAFGNKNIFRFANYSTDIQYHIENKSGKTLYTVNNFQDQAYPSDPGLIQRTGKVTGELGYIKFNESFIPQKEEDLLTFVLDRVIKTVPSDFSIKVNPKELKEYPLSFEYEGNFNTIKKVDMQTDISMQEISPETEQVLVIEMEGQKEVPSSDLVSWAIVDDKGEVYGAAFHSGSILDEKDENGRFKTNATLTFDGLREIPNEFTLHLISVKRYEEVEKEWKVPLYKES